MKIKLYNSNKIMLIDKSDYIRLKSEYPNHWRYNNGYACVSKNGKIYYIHRLINNTPSNLHTDHRDHNKLNNQKSNIRNATIHQNAVNHKKYKNNTSGYIGVSKHIGKWQSHISHNQKLMHLGLYDTPEEAARARDKKAVELYGEFAKLNFPLLA